jgi:ABC-2 type transport system ATP-binding protein
MTASALLETRNLTKTFGSRTIINRLNLHISAGDVYGFLGQNGQGKTTTIRMITGLIYPDSGDVYIGGYSLKNDFKRAIAQVGAIVESPSFYGYLSGYDNLVLMANLIPGTKKENTREVLEMVGLATRAKDKVKTYSLGMKQRLGIANALLGDPKLIILDEPTNGLDPQGMREIKEIIHQLASERNITFFISSHLLHEVEQICNRIGIIDGGNLLCESTIEELLQKANGKSLEDIYFDIVGKGGVGV